MGNIDILYCNSGILAKTIGPLGDIQQIPIEMFEDTWRINTGIHILVCICVPLLFGREIKNSLRTLRIAYSTGPSTHGVSKMG